MKKIAIFSLLIIILFGCTGKSQDEKTKEMATESKPSVDLLQGSTPIDFTAEATDGSTFNSADNKGKYWAIFVYDRSYLTKSESYDMVAELNETYKKFGSKIPMLGIANGFSDDEKAIKALFAKAKFSFKQIDNTRGPEKDERINDNVFCTPAKILIDPTGKVVYNGCGGKTESFNYKLDSLINSGKF